MPLILIIGAGPAGLTTAVHLKRQGVAFHWIDREALIGGAYRQMYSGITLASPARHSALPELPLNSNGAYVTAGEYFDYLKRYAQLYDVTPQKATVEKIERQNGEFTVCLTGESQPRTYRAVVVATGMFDHPKFPDIPGSAANNHLKILHSRDWAGPELLAGRRILIIGGKISGIEIAEAHAQSGFSITLSAENGRATAISPRFLGRDIHDYAVLLERIPVKFASRFCRNHPTFPGLNRGFQQLVQKGAIRIVPEVSRFEKNTAFFKNGATGIFDAVIAATGYSFKTPFLPSSVARAPKGHPLTICGESISWKGLFFMGFPCSRGLDSEFLRGMARDVSLVTRRLLSGLRGCPA